VPDTNVLLTLYRLPETTRGKLLEVLEQLKNRLFVPYQVGVEFQRNRLNVIEEQMATYAQVEKAIDSFAESVGKGLRQHPRLDRDNLERRIADALAPVKSHLEGLRESHPDPLTENDPLGADAVRDALDPLLTGRIGEPRDLQSLVAEGRKRYEQKIPPGWGDEKKPEPDRYGDLAIWFDVVAKAEAEQKPLILVTEERKPDWWSIRHNQAVGPRPELIEEMREKSGQLLWIYGLQRFVEMAAESLGIEFNEDERDDVFRAESAAAKEEALAKHIPFDLGQTIVSTDIDNLARRIAHADISGQNLLWLDPASHALLDSLWSRGRSLDSGWVATVEPDEESALLRVLWHSRLLSLHGRSQSANRLLCKVIGPHGEAAFASRRDTTLKASFRYPDNFVGAQSAEPGRYTFSWHFSDTDDEPTEEIASGEFEIPQGSPAQT